MVDKLVDMAADPALIQLDFERDLTITSNMTILLMHSCGLGFLLAAAVLYVKVIKMIHCKM